MTRVMYDALPGAFHGIPQDAQMVAGYIDGGPGFPVMTDDLWALYPNAVHVRIATQARTNDGHVLDVEAGDATPAQAPGWATMRRNAGAHPSVYCSSSQWGAVKAEFDAQGVAYPEWWIASYATPPDTSIPVGAVAHQWGGNMDGGYDVSSVVDYWPGVDPDPIPEDETTMILLSASHCFLLLGSIKGRDFTGTRDPLYGIPADAAATKIPVRYVTDAEAQYVMQGSANILNPPASSGGAVPLHVTLTGTATP